MDDPRFPNQIQTHFCNIYRTIFPGIKRKTNLEKSEGGVPLIKSLGEVRVVLKRMEVY